MHTYFKKCRWGDFLLLRGDMIGDYVNLYGEWCEAEVTLFRRLLSAESVVVEVGSNIGMHSVPIARFCERGKVFCFEPQRIIFHLLCANLALNNLTNVIARNCAVGNTTRIIDIESTAYDTPWNYGAFSLASGFSAERGYAEATTREPIPLVRLDDDHALQAIKRLDLLKIDAEGSEPEVLDGARGVIERFRPAIFIENNAAERFDRLLGDIQARGYLCYWFRSRRARPDNFNRTSWMVTGQDINMLCISCDHPQPADLQLVNSYSDLRDNKVPLY
jgi:FkbM family methyltransferase